MVHVYTLLPSGKRGNESCSKGVDSELAYVYMSVTLRNVINANVRRARMPCPCTTWCRRRIALAHTYTWRRRHIDGAIACMQSVSDAKAMTGDVGAVSDGRHNHLHVSAASPAGSGAESGIGMSARDALLPARLFLRAILVCTST